MEQAGKAIFNALKRLSKEERPLDFLAAVWPLIVGPRMARQTSPVLWEKGRVEIAVNDREWQRQLEKMGGEVRNQINKWWGKQAVREVSFLRARQGQRDRQPDSEAKAEERAPEKVWASSAMGGPRIDQVLKDFEKALTGINDKELRKLVSNVAQKYLAATQD